LEAVLFDSILSPTFLSSYLIRR